MQIVINCGGVGSRLWPVSTEDMPKQFVPLLDSESLLQKTYSRIAQGFDPESIWVLTNEKYLAIVKRQLPMVPESRLITEQERRDSYAALTANSAVIASRTSVDEPIIYVHSDHVIPESDTGKVISGLKEIEKALKSNKFEIVTAGVKPLFANSMLGYIEVSNEHADKVFEETSVVHSFREKPTSDIAQGFLDAGNYLWNLGYFGFAYKTIYDIIARLYPEDALVLDEIYTTGVLTGDLMNKLPKIQFEVRVVEHLDTLGVIGMNIEWEDIGSWKIMSEYIRKADSSSRLYQSSGSGNLVHSTTDDIRPIAFVGVSNLLVVDSPNGILIIDPEHSSAVKDIVSKLPTKSS